MAFHIQLQPGMGLGEAVGGAAAGGLSKLIESRRNTKTEQALGLPKGTIALFGGPEGAVKGMQLMREIGLAKRFMPDATGQPSARQEMMGIAQQAQPSALDEMMQGLDAENPYQLMRDQAQRPVQQPMQQAPQQRGPRKVTEQDLFEAAGTVYEKPLIAQYESQKKAGEAEREFGYKRGGKVLEDIGSASQTMPERELALQSMKNAIDKNETGLFSSSNLSRLASQLTGLDLPVNATGAQMQAAQKTFLVNTLNKVGAKGLNQYLEKQIASSFPMIGQSKEANQQSLLLHETAFDLERKFQDTVYDLYKRQVAEQGYPNPDLDLQAQQAMKPYVKGKLKEYEEASKAIGKSAKKEEKATFSTLEEVTKQRQPKKGDEVRNKKTGKRYAWDGKEWKELKK